MVQDVLSNMIITDVVAAYTMYSMDTWHLKVTNRPQWGMLIKYEGETTYTSNGKTFIADANHIMILPQGTSYELKCTKPGHFALIEFECSTVFCEPIRISVKDGKAILNQFKDLEYRRNLKGSMHRIESIKNLYLILFSLLTVFRVIPYIMTLSITFFIVILFDRKLILNVDYSLLFTFVFLFIFIGNLGEIKPISDFLKGIVNNNEVIVGIISSQVFSNVPATILLSKFTENAKDLLIGVNLGGLGTLIASMASLISFKFVAKEKVNMGKYILTFTIVNIVFLALNLGLWSIIK